MATDGKVVPIDQLPRAERRRLERELAKRQGALAGLEIDWEKGVFREDGVEREIPPSALVRLRAQRAVLEQQQATAMQSANALQVMCDAVAAAMGYDVETKRPAATAPTLVAPSEKPKTKPGRK